MTPADVTDYNNSAIGTDSNSSYSEETDQTLDGLQGAVGGGQRSKVEIEMESLSNRLKIDDSSRFKERDITHLRPNPRRKHSHQPPPVRAVFKVHHLVSLQEIMMSGPRRNCLQAQREEDEEDTEEEKAPFELIGEFLESVMDADYEAADKLCKMILLYEPDNKECKQFQPLIEEMLKREREEELWGSDDDSDDSDEDDDDDDDDESDDSEGDSDEETESSSEESSDESSSEADEEEGQR
ncbi:putative eukaryotic translation initiation factor 5B-like [Apostichopus japonicus]|uniref:Putative eukaryotic translation initiation factor 5B-like n=1 Tax=Stichopus japonicus TaxID=307972 RepID=A0A2G8KEA1_STIJA|nr:putative eukaryotic translation initiation factor 5B-like [Apostichopus japonicus]